MNIFFGTVRVKSKKSDHFGEELGTKVSKSSDKK